MFRPLVSILIPCFDAEQWIAQAIQSALEQTWPEKEVIVVDDGSSDRSLEIIQSFGSQVQWETRINSGGNRARNRLLDLSRGEWLQYLDADDYLLPSKVELQMDCVRQHPEADLIFSEVMKDVLTANGQSEVKSNPIPDPFADPWIALARWYLPQTGGQLWKRSSLIEVGGWNVDQPCCQENELYGRLLAHNKKFVYCPSKGAVYREWHDNTVSRREPLRVFRERVKILRKAEAHLNKTGQMTAPRRAALNQARFEIARVVWPMDRAMARELHGIIRRATPHFTPESSTNPLYRITYRVLGFQLAEFIAGILRCAKSLVSKRK